ncbi:MAG TPA: copper-binding protein [Pyrinomonadaceae bacterium]|nr:copper-binding protein [Pyrinomonadaceae bacterium]
MGRLLILVAVLGLISACQQNAAETKPQNAKPTQTTNANKNAPTPDASKIKTYKSKGVVTKINLEIVSVELNHEKIEDLMPAMTMEFYVKEKSELEVLKVGDKVEFVLEDNQGQEKIISIKKL